MGDGDWDALASELVRQNYTFVATFSVLLWDCLITFHQEVKYVWHCQSRVTKYQFLFCRYWAVGYFIFCSIFDTQWALRTSTSSKDCRTWFLIHAASLNLLYLTVQVSLIKKVFNLYGRSTLLATGLFAFHCCQVTGSLILSKHVSGSLDFNPICNGRKVPIIILAVFAMILFAQCITWALILRKVWKVQTGFFLRWRRYLRTSEAHARLSWGLCLVAILFNTSHSFANQQLANVYIFTFPMTMFSIGICRYILRAEKNSAILAEAIDTAEHKQSVGEEQSHCDGLTTRSRPRHSYPSQPPAKAPRPPSHLEALSIQMSESEAEGHNVDTLPSNFPYLHGAQSYKLNRNRRSMATAITNSLTDYSPPSSSAIGSRHTADFWSSVRSRAGSGLSLGTISSVETEATDAANQNDVVEDTQGASDIEIGSLHYSSSVNSEELRQFYNDMWNVGPFMS